MRSSSRIVLSLLLASSLIGLGGMTQAAPGDWPQYHGPNRDAVCTETGLLPSWPAAGPKLLWSLKGLGRGYSTIAIAAGKLYTMGDRAGDGAEKQMVQAYDLATRKPLWAAPIGAPHSGGGPRCTPTVDGKLLYAIGTDGDLACLETASGKVVWKKNFAADFNGRMMCMRNGTVNWRFSESPLVDGDKLLCTPGGPQATIVALNKHTGATIWKCAVPKLGDRGGDGAGYTSMLAADIEGVRQYMQFIGRGVVGVEAATGRFLWGYNQVANDVANISTPIVRGNFVFASAAYKAGSGLVKITRDGDRFRADEVYFLDSKTFSNHHGGVVLVGDCVYGGDGQNSGAPTCIDFSTGKTLWKEKALAKGSAGVLAADGHLVFRYDSGLVALIEANPKAFHVKGSFQPPGKPSGPHWAHPVIHQKKLYLRDNDVLLCYDLAG